MSDYLEKLQEKERELRKQLDHVQSALKTEKERLDKNNPKRAQAKKLAKKYYGRLKCRSHKVVIESKFTFGATTSLNVEWQDERPEFEVSRITYPDHKQVGKLVMADPKIQKLQELTKKLQEELGDDKELCHLFNEEFNALELADYD